MTTTIEIADLQLDSVGYVEVGICRNCDRVVVLELHEKGYRPVYGPANKYSYVQRGTVGRLPIDEARCARLCRCDWAREQLERDRVKRRNDR